MRIDVIIVCGMAAVAWATGEAMPQTTTQAILGKWTCSSDTPYGRIVSELDYADDGSMKGLSTITIPPSSGSGATIAVVETSSSWTLLDGGMIQEEVIRAEVISAKRDGREVSRKVRGQMARSMIRPFDPEKLEISPEGMVRFDPNTGSRTVCTR
ncbi:MAG: hypothetical protein Q8R82_23115 [Hyphomonadaceae bacterium]|nr:hypothetical protein [Hyphomonadaceae bacterium]